MKNFRYILLFNFVFLFSHTAIFGQTSKYATFYKSELFQQVQLNHLFSDQKMFTDFRPKYEIQYILDKYQQHKPEGKAELKKFVAENFDTLFTDTSQVIRHIENLWDILLRKADEADENSSLIPLPYPYIVPGGRFREIYYWDSYFTMLGLKISGKYEVIENMIDNFSYLMDTYGFIPNGNRTYYLSRSQPPFYALMIELLADSKGDSVYMKYMPYLEKEYSYWMKGRLDNPLQVNKDKVVFFEKGECLNRYYDELDQPRPESFSQDYNLCKQTGRGDEIFRELRSAAESGWDFSSRWFTGSLETIETTHFVPVDLNCLLYKMETILAKASLLSGDKEKSAFFRKEASQRKQLINKYLYDKEACFYGDYNFVTGKISEQWSLAAMYPLFVGIADKEQASAVSHIIRNRFLQPGGVVTTLNNTGEQWDWPNGWPPLQWITYKGLKNYGFEELATELAQRWINLNVKVYFETGKMTEKYNVVDIHLPGGGGEYPLQDGFGWTNGVFLVLWEQLNSVK